MYRWFTSFFVCLIVGVQSWDDWLFELHSVDNWADFYGDLNFAVKLEYVELLTTYRKRFLA